VSIYKNLQPHVHVLKLTGGTGDGKTEIATVFASKEARTVLLRGVGRTNSTLKERLLVYSEEYADKLLVAVKLNVEPYDKLSMSDLFVSSVAKVVRSQGKVVDSVVGKDEEELKKYLIQEMQAKNNAKAVLSFLTEEQKTKIINDLVDIYHSYYMSEYNYEIYNSVRNNLPEGEAKDNSTKFLSALKNEVERMIDIQGEKLRESLWDVLAEINQQLHEVFFEYFSKRDISEDGYYYKEIYLANPDETFIDAMFTANDIQNGQRLSLEVFCNDIVIYIPVSQAITKIIRSNEKTNAVFKDNRDKVIFGIFDTRGLFHAENTEDDNADYLNDLLYQGDADALLMVVPLFGDSNEKKIQELYKTVFATYSKQIPAFMIHNKVDLFVDSIRKDSYMDDPLSMDMELGQELSSKEIISAISAREQELREEIQNAQTKSRQNLKIKSLSCYLKRDGSMQEEIVKRYNISNVIMTIFADTADYLEKSAVKIPVKTDRPESEVVVRIDKARLAEIVHEYLFKDVTNKKVFAPGLEDLRLSIGKTPHGNSYYALRRRLKYGDGYTCNIDESYYYNCKSFSINFTANLRNFVSTDMAKRIVKETMKLSGGYFTKDKDEEEFYYIVEGRIFPKMFVGQMLYHKAMLSAEQEAVGFMARFQKFLKNSQRFFDSGNLDEQAYVDAMYHVVYEAAQRALNMNVTLR